MYGEKANTQATCHENNCKISASFTEVFDVSRASIHTIQAVLTRYANFYVDGGAGRVDWIIEGMV